MSQEQVDHSARKHALLSASGAHRWMHCTPSAKLEEKFEISSPSKSSVYADEGTLAHEFGQLGLQLKAGIINQTLYNSESKKLKKHKLYKLEMDYYVEIYVDYVWECYLVAKAEFPETILMIEERLDFSHLVEQGFGTGDAEIITPEWIQVIDLKYGKGIKVNAKENPQLKLYGSGAYRKYELHFDFKRVKLTIVQPRLEHIDSWETTVPELIAWGEQEVRPKATLAYLGLGSQYPGDWCKFCKVKGMCAALAAENVDLARYDFQEPALLEMNQILEIFQQIPMLVDWANGVGEFLLKKALSGEPIKGYKLVEGRSNRKWVDEDKCKEALKKLGFKEDQFTVVKLEGVPTIEKLIGKKQFPVVMGSHVILPPGKPTLAPDSDKRPAMGTAQAQMDFAEETEE